ncbi:hypothetical protein ACFQL0_08025 [Haloplanus litoreus]|uniref:DUF7285 family protein n=1 Tax=Haloplanus litoreus TaxID=767515 RepID=UPI0036222F17
MSRSSGRGQVEPTAALVVLLAVTAAVSTYAIALDGAVRGGKRDIAEPTLDRVVGTLVTGGVVDPERRRRAHRSGPSGYRLNLTVAAGDDDGTLGRHRLQGRRPTGRVGRLASV